MERTWGRFLALLTVMIACCAAHAQQTTEQWQQDLDTLAEQLLTRHPNFYTKHTVEEFEDALDAVYAKLDTHDDQQIVMELGRLVALGGDAHTTIGFGNIGAGMHRLAIQCVVLDDGVFVNAALDSRKDLIGKRVVSINTVPIDEVIDRVSVLFAFENNSKKIGTAAAYATLLPALRAVGIIEDHRASSVPVELEFEAEIKSIDLECAATQAGQRWVSFVQQLPQPWPLAYRKQSGYYASEFIAEHRAMYVAYNRCREAEDLPMARFVEFIMSKSDELDAQRIIIDLRFNGGGDETVIWPLWQALEKSDRFKDKGDIIGLISRQTFSSAMSNSHQLRDNCGAVLIGEPTGGKPNHFGQLSSFTLPNSGVSINHSTRWFQKVEGDPDAVIPDLLVPWRSEALFGGIDETLDTALDYTTSGSDG